MTLRERGMWSVAIAILVAAVLLPRLLDLDAFLTADEKRWQANTAGFLRDLSLGRFGELLKQPHPGITTQWLGAITVLSDSWAVRKLPLVIGQSILVFAAGYVFFRLWGKGPALLLTLLLTLNPVLIAHTRVYAMDSLLGLFFLLSLGLLLLWHKTGARRYLVASGAAGALAVLSKVPGIIIVPCAVAVLLLSQDMLRNPRVVIRSLLLWCGGFFIALIFVFPSIILNTHSVLGDLREFFSSSEYQEAHRGSPWFYLSTLVFSSTPLQMLGIVLLPLVWIIPRRSSVPVTRRQIAVFLFIAVLFALSMSVGAKKGDRYILPVFLLLDTLAVAVLSWLWPLRTQKIPRAVCVAALLLAIGWQGWVLWRLHPYELAYVNPFTQRFLGDRRMGWGEGLDLAAEYLNAKPDAAHLKVGSYYPVEFEYRFAGDVVPLHMLDDARPDYLVLYRAMFERGPDAWETDILERFRGRTPEHVVTLNGLEYAWIYKP